MVNLNHIEQSVDQLEAIINRYLATVADELRNAVIEFNEKPPTLQTIDAFRARVLIIADLAAGVFHDATAPESGMPDSLRDHLFQVTRDIPAAAVTHIFQKKGL